MTLPERFWDKVVPEPNSGCWLWTASTSPKGYGQYWWRGKLHRAHRLAYRALTGPIPRRRHLDHKCRTRCCVNPDHLRPVTNRQNVLCGTSPAAKNARKTHCPTGHEYTESNTYVDRKNRRYCRACNRRRMKARAA